MSVGDRIREERMERNWTQQELADKSGFSRNTIVNWENGLRSPQQRFIDKIAEAFGIPVSALTGAKESGDLSRKRILYEMRSDKTLIPVEPSPLDELLRDHPKLEIWFRQQAESFEGKERLAKLMSDLIDRWEAEDGKEKQ